MKKSRTLVWLFDLDDTLHHASRAIFPHINHHMTHYMGQHLGLEIPAANALRLHYWQRYGATLLGLLRHHSRHHKINAQHFLEHTHRFDNLHAMIHAERGLPHLFAKLPGRKCLFTNAPSNYARQVLTHLRLQRQIRQRYAVEQLRLHGQYRPKPSRAMLRALLQRERIAPARCVLVDDSVQNLRAAHACGIRTVWVCGRTTKKIRPHYVDLKIQSVRGLLRHFPFFSKAA